MALALLTLVQRCRRRGEQLTIMVKPISAAQFELDAVGRELAPTALQPRQHILHGTQPEGDAGGDLS